jgi:hypothetical protein
MANSKLNLTRDQLALFLKDHESIKQFERLFATVDAIAPDFVNEVAISAGNAQATANDALALIDALENSLTADGAVTDAKATLALQELQALKSYLSDLQLKALEPAQQNNNSIVTDYLTINEHGRSENAVGRMIWDDGEGTIDFGLKGGNVVCKIGVQEYVRAYNDTLLTMTKGQIVYISGAQGNRIAVNLAQADSDANSAHTIGIVAETITARAEGFVQVSGPIYKLNTLGTIAGDTVYLSPTIAGAFTTTKPVAPNHLVVVGFIERVHATVGSIFIKVDNGYELDELHNVKITSIQPDDLLQYDSAGPYWKNVPLSSLSIGTATNLSGGAAGSVPYQSAASTTTFLGIGASNYVLTSTGTAPTWTANTGTGSVVRETSPTLVTPLLGTPTSGNFSTGTFTWPTFNQNTTGSAAKWTTARTLAGNSVDGSANVAFANKFIVQGTADAGLSGAQFLGALGTGIVKNTTTTGVLSIAVAGDFPTLNQNTTGTAAGLSATLVATSGGTGQSSYAVGDLLYASTTTALSRLADVATGNALISGGVGVAPAWGKIGLTTHVSGTLGVGNGGTGTATAFTTGSVVFAGASGVYTQDAAQLFWDATNNRLGVGTGTPSYTIHSTGIIGSTLTGSATTGAGQLYLNGATSNRIDFNTNGSAAPAFTTRSAGTKICLNPQVAAAAADYAFGIATNALWASVPTSTQFFSWYAGTTEVLRMKGNGELVIGNGDTAAVPVAANLRGTNGSGTNIVGADMRVHGGRGTGTGAGGYVRVFTTPAGAASGATLNTEVEAITVGPQGDIGFGTTTPTNFPDYKSIYMENTTGDGVSLTWQSTLVTAYLDVSDALGVTLVAATTHPVSISSGGIEAANFTTSQRTLLGGVTENANGGVLQLSEGITFPATQVAATDANTLDDYEEGNFTPTIVGTTTAGAGTYTIQVGRYTKIGRSVNIQFRVTWTAHTGTGNMTVGGLPFTSLNTANTHASVSIGYASNIVYTAGATPMGFIAPNTTVITLVQMPSGGGAMAVVALDTAGDYMISANYITA